MKRNVLMKKNKILALALAAAMALTSAPMSTVYAEEETPITNEADGGGDQGDTPSDDVQNDAPSDDGEGDAPSDDTQNDAASEDGQDITTFSGDQDARVSNDSPYILAWQGEDTLPNHDGGVLGGNGRLDVATDCKGKPVTLKFNTGGTTSANLANEITGGTAVVEFELMPAGKVNETVTFYNRNNSGDTKQPLFTVGAYETTNGYELWLTDKRETKDANKLFKLVEEEIPKNTWMKGKAVFYLDDTSDGVMKWDVQMAYYSSKDAYSTDESNWIYGKKASQADLIALDEAKYSNGTVSQTFEFMEIKNIDFYLNQNTKGTLRWLGDFKVSNVTAVTLAQAPRTQVAGEEFIPGEGALTVEYSTGKSETVKLADLALDRDYTVSDFGDTAAQGKEITIRYMGMDVTTNVDVIALSSVAVTTQPTTQNYVINAPELDLTGLVLTETYSDNSTKELTDLEVIKELYDFGVFDASAAGTKNITVTNKKNNAVATSFNVTVNDVKLASIAVKTPPTKTEYFVGDTEVSTEGLVVEGTYDDGTTVVTLTADDYVVGALDSSSAGNKDVTITAKAQDKNGKDVTCTFSVTVKEAVITGIEVTKKPDKLSYMLNDAADYTGMVVNAIYDSGAKKEIAAADCTISGFDSSKAAAGQVITVSYGGFSAEFNISIVDPSVFTPVEYNFDFNIEGSKTADGWTGIFVNKKNGKKYGLQDYGYSADKGYGINTTVTALQGRSETVLANGAYSSIPSDVYTDYVLLGNAKGSFDVDIPNGTYNVQIVVGTTYANTTTVKIENNEAYTGSATIGADEVKAFKVIEIPGVTVSDGQMNILTTADGNARTNAVIISNINAPTDVEGTFDNTDVSVSLTWKASLGCTSYNIYRTLDGVTEKIGTVEGTSFKDTQIEALKSYTYFVRGVSEKGLETVASANVELEIVDSSKPAPATPGNAVISDRAPDSVTLSWDAVENVIYYEIYAADKSSAAETGLDGYELLGTSKTTSFEYKNAKHLDKSYKVVAAGLGGRSEATAIITSAEALPKAPADFKVAGMTAEATSLSWSAAENAKYYEIYYINKNDAEGKEGLDGFTLAGKTTDTNYACSLENHMELLFKVAPVGLKGRGDATDVAKSEVPAPETPVNLQVEVAEESTTLTWDAMPNASYYEIYWSDRDRTSLAGTKYETKGLEDYELIGTSNEAKFVYNLPTHIVRYFKVVAVGLGGKSAASELVKADIVKQFNVQAEYLDRALIAMKVDGGVYVGWRLAGDEYAKNASYVLYRDGAAIRTFTAEENTSFLDVDGTESSKYAVSVVIDGTEGEKCEEVSVQGVDYLEVKMDVPEPYYDSKLTKEHIKSQYKSSEIDATHIDLSTGDYTYIPNDTYVGDVDGDGEYEIIVKWDGMSRDNSQHGYTSPVYIDCYKLDGTRLWRINLGINIRAGAHYTQPVVADLDGDGKAEVMMRTADGSVDAAGTPVDGTEEVTDYRTSGSQMGHIITGPDYLTLFDGETGIALDTIEYIPQRGKVGDWGDSYGGRSERYLSGAAYLDGENLYAVFARGYYTRAVVAAFDVVDKKIVTYWVCDSKDEANKSLYGQGAHSFTVADVDGDGCQEVVYGSATIDNDGKLLYSLSDYGKRYGGHGDAERVTDMNLKNPGLEAFMVHEEHPNDAAVEMHDAANGQFIYKVYADADVGRGAAGDIDPNYEGVESWSTSDVGMLRAADGTEIGSRPSSVNHMAWFNGDMGREFVDGKNGGEPYWATWNWETGKMNASNYFTGCYSNNTTKANPCFQADIFGDWREELAFRTQDNTAIRIYTSTEVMDYRLYSLMHDPTYRAQMACNGSAYNQSPDAGFYIGYDTDLMQVPVPTLNVVKAGEEKPDPSPEPGEPTPEPSEPTPEPGEPTPEPGEPTPEPSEPTPEPGEPTPVPSEPTPEPGEPTPVPTAVPMVKPEVKDEIPDSVMTEEVKNATGCNTVEELVNHIVEDVKKKAEEVFKALVSGSNVTVEGEVHTEVREVSVQISLDEGRTWVPATEENFPKTGVKIVLDYPEGTNKDDYVFVVSHLITMNCNGQKAGEIVNEEYTKTDAGLELTIMSASPFTIGWSKVTPVVEEQPDEPEDDDPEETGEDVSDNKTAPGKTGDNMYVFLWMWTMVLAAAASVGAYVVVKRRRNR